jgi:RNA polymerase sigma-32 factor
MESRLTGHDMAFDPLDSDDEDASFAPAQFLEDESQDPALRYEAEHTAENESTSLYQALEQLDERSRDIVQQRWLNEEKATLHDLAAQYGVSAERIRQIEQAAMKKLKGSILA